MSRFAAEADIERSADDIWTYAADILRHTEWMSVQAAELLAGDGTQAGARGRERMRVGPFMMDLDVEVVEALPGRRLVWRAKDPRFDLEVSLELEPRGPASTHARYSGSAQFHGLWKVLTPLFAMEGTAGLKAELEKLKERVESAPAAVAAAS